MPTTVHHPIFARFYARLAQASDSMLARHRTELLAPALGRVVEVGAGSGSNFARYPTTVESVLALEPEPYLRDAAEVAAGHASMPIEVRDAVAEELPVETGSVDAVVFSLVLCSIGDVATAHTECHPRGLRTGPERELGDLRDQLGGQVVDHEPTEVLQVVAELRPARP